MQELLSLLLPLAAASGWFAAAVHYQKSKSKKSAEFSKKYYRGLTYLLEENADKALDVFLELIKADHETVEMHLALANLFRRRGEVERAIKIHQSLLEQKDLSQDHHAQARFELGMDYMRAGMYGLAEEYFKNSTENGHHRVSALQELLKIYQQEKDWLKAIAVIQELKQLGKTRRGERIAHFYCELAEAAKSSGKAQLAGEYLSKAFSEDATCVRASLIKAEMAIAEKNYADALKMLKAVESQNPAYISEIVEPVLKCCASLQDPEQGERYLHALYEKFRNIEIVPILSLMIYDRHGVDRAVEFLESVLTYKPFHGGFMQLISFYAEQQTGKNRIAFLKLKEFAAPLSRKGTAYRCSRCGFECNRLHWRCPSCHYWESIKPKPPL